jgi:hypothetical protein
MVMTMHHTVMCPATQQQQQQQQTAGRMSMQQQQQMLQGQGWVATIRCLKTLPLLPPLPPQQQQHHSSCCLVTLAPLALLHRPCPATQLQQPHRTGPLSTLQQLRHRVPQPQAWAATLTFVQ